MEDIIIGGISINTLKEQKKTLRQGASKFISDNIEAAKQIVSKIVESEDADEIETLSAEALKLLEATKLVSDVSGVQYYLPYNEQWDSGNALSDDLDDEDNELLTDYRGEALSALYDLLQEMEYDSFMWNSSSVGC